jgi:excisionase family DNA binding protein
MERDMNLRRLRGTGRLVDTLAEHVASNVAARIRVTMTSSPDAARSNTKQATVLTRRGVNDALGRPASPPLQLPKLPDVETVDEFPVEVLPAVLIHLMAMQARITARLATAPRSPAPAPDVAPDEWLTPTEVAALRKVPVSWVRENARRGKLRSHQIGHYVRFRRSELDEDLRALERRVRGV